MSCGGGKLKVERFEKYYVFCSFAKLTLLEAPAEVGKVDIDQEDIDQEDIDPEDLPGELQLLSFDIHCYNCYYRDCTSTKSYRACSMGHNFSYYWNERK